jgi:lipoyl synthase
MAPRPSWLRAKAPSGDNYRELVRLVEDKKLHTVCQSANCPNIGECWKDRTATFMILGGKCTRNCRFCAVEHGNLEHIDEDEPRRVAEAVVYLNLKHAVITSVTRDDLDDGGAIIFAETIRMIHQSLPDCSVEVLIPDLQGDEKALTVILDEKPEILNHNVETVERLYLEVRPQAIYNRSLELLKRAKDYGQDIRVKSGLMVGLGESWDELLKTITDIKNTGCDILTVGQYLSPSRYHHKVDKYYTPEEFEKISSFAVELGFSFVESAPLVRSSYHAAKHKV